MRDIPKILVVDDEPDIAELVSYSLRKEGFTFSTASDAEETHVITYIIKHHVPGRIRLDVPVLQKIAEYRLRKISKALTRLPVFMGIRDLTVNPGNGSVAIEYDAEVVDIIDYLEDMSVIVETLDCLEGHR